MKLTWLCIRLAHNELILDEGLLVDWAVFLLLSPVLSHVLVSACEEFIGGLLKGSFLILRLECKCSEILSSSLLPFGKLLSRSHFVSTSRSMDCSGP